LNPIQNHGQLSESKEFSYLKVINISAIKEIVCEGVDWSYLANDVSVESYCESNNVISGSKNVWNLLTG
jgi:hypothetical protein